MNTTCFYLGSSTWTAPTIPFALAAWYFTRHIQLQVAHNLVYFFLLGTARFMAAWVWWSMALTLFVANIETVSTWAVEFLALSATVASEIVLYSHVPSMKSGPGGSSCFTNWLPWLRVAMVGLVTLLLTEPIVSHEEEREEERWVAVLVDQSDSMNLPSRSASDAGKTRGQVAQQLMVGDGLSMTGMLQRLSNNYQVRLYRFGSSPRVVSQDQWPQASLNQSLSTVTPSPVDVPSSTPWSQTTNMAAALAQVSSNLPLENLSGVLMLSDGCDHSDSNLEQSSRQMVQHKVPINTVLIGSQVAVKDAEVATIQAPAQIYLGDIAIAEGDPLTITATGADLSCPMLQILDDEKSDRASLPIVVSSHVMARDAESMQARFWLSSVTEPVSYRIESSGLYSPVYRIRILPRPVLDRIAAHLDYPQSYDATDAQIHDVTETIEVPRGTQIRLMALSRLRASQSKMDFNNETKVPTEIEAADLGEAESDDTAPDQIWSHAWELDLSQQLDSLATITLVSEEGVSSQPRSIRIRVRPEDPAEADTEETQQPDLQQLAQVSQQLQQQLTRAIDKLTGAKATIDKLSQVDDPSIDREDQATTADDGKTDPDKLPNDNTTALQSLVQQLDDANNELQELEKSKKIDSELDEKIERAQEIAKQELAEARKQAQEIKVDESHASIRSKANQVKPPLAAATEKLTNLLDKAKQRAEETQVAAQLDQLAQQQRALEKAMENEPTKEALEQQRADLTQADSKTMREQSQAGQKDAQKKAKEKLSPEDQMAKRQTQQQAAIREKQQAIAKEVQKLVTQDENARAAQYQRRADQAEQLEKQARELADQPPSQQSAQPPSPVQQPPKAENGNQAQQAQRRVDDLKQAAKELLEQPSDDRENERLAKVASQKVNEAVRQAKIAAQQPDQAKPSSAKQAMYEAADALKSYCQSCKQCANCDRPGNGSGSSKSGARRPNPDRMAQASEQTSQAAAAPSREKLATAARTLDQLADDAAKQVNCDRKPKGQTTKSTKPKDQSLAANNPGECEESDNPKAEGTGKRAATTARKGQPGSDQLEAVELRGGSSSDWTRSNKKLKSNVLDDKQANIPEQYKQAVHRYFEELSRMDSEATKTERQP